MENKNWWILPIVVVLLGGLIWWRGNNSTEPQTTNTGSNVLSSEETTQRSPVDPDGNEEVVDYALHLANFSFTPDLIEIEPGQTVKVKLVNVEGTHDFVLDELKVRSSVLNQGEEQIIEIEIPQDAAGQTYEFYCSVGNHRQLGMDGILRVSEL